MIAQLQKNTTDILQHAIRFHELGWSLLPIKPGTKRSAIKWKDYQTERPSIGQVEDWFSENNYGIAVIFGIVSGGLASIDFDNERLYEMWQQHNRMTAQRLPTVKTPRGYHVYFKLSDVQRERLRHEFDSTGNGAIPFDNGELRFGEGCYSVLPPSIHPDGVKYEWKKLFDDVPHIDDSELQNSLRIFTSELKNNTPANTQSNTRHPLHVSHFSEKPIKQGVCSTSEKSINKGVSHAIKATRPAKHGERNRKIFDFARQLKSIPELQSAEPKELKEFVRKWHENALPFIGTKCFDETWEDFVIAWENVNHVATGGSVSQAVRQAKEKDYPPEADEYENDKTQLLVALCYELQGISGGGKPFFLSVRSIDSVGYVASLR